MTQCTCKISIKNGLAHPRRSVALLEYPASYVDITKAYSALDERYYLKSFDVWMDGHSRPKRYHGWNPSDYDGRYAHCYVFKNVDAGERLYGFLCRPKEPADFEYEMCVLVLYAKKKKDKTDPAELARAERMRTDIHVQAALLDPELFRNGEGKCSWIR